MATKAKTTSTQGYKAQQFNEHFKPSSIKDLDECLNSVITALIYALDNKYANPQRYIALLSHVWDTRNNHHAASKWIREERAYRSFPDLIAGDIDRYLNNYDFLVKREMPTGFEPGSPNEDAAYLASLP